MTSPFFQLHHIGMLVKDIEAASQLQVARYGYRLESEIIHDSIQTAWVRFLRLPNAENWLELVAPENENSKLFNSLSKRGEGLHHLCFEVSDLAASIGHLREGKQLLLSGPTPAVAFGGRCIAWFMDRAGLLTELVEAGKGPLTLASISPRPLKEPC